MKKLVKVFALAVMLIMGGQAMAQTRGALFLGASFPMKDFAAFDDFNDFALTSNYDDSDDAGAGIGFNAGIKWYFNVGVEGLGVMLSVDGFYNGPGSDLKTAYRDMESSYDGQIYDGSFKYNATPKYINVPAMLGVNYIYHINPNFGVYAEAGAGGNLRFITEMESVNKMSLLGVETQTTTTQAYDKAFSFAWQAGVGIEVAKNLVIGCSFYDLGKAQVEGDQTVKTKTIETGSSNTTTNHNSMGIVHPMMFLGRIGFSF
ncbi:MAG: PorT family protein [Bacteroidales bacterium]|nr:PorT family protein [Bacteroidales bacterium]